MQLVRPPDARYREVLDACEAGFGAQPWNDETAALERTVWEFDRTFAIEDDGRYVATTISYSFELTVPGGAQVPAAGVAMVTVLPTHRRRGLLRQLMTATLDLAAERGEPYALLNASESGIYGRFGFGIADRVQRIEIDTRHASFVAPVAAGSFRLIERETAADVVAPLYDRIGRRRVGAFSRTRAWWNHVLAEAPQWRGGGSPFVVIHHDEAGTPDGYAIYRSTELMERDHPSGRIDVRELEADTTEVETALWRFLCDIDLRSLVVAHPRPMDDALPWRLAEPRRAMVSGSGDLLWACPVDVEQVLATRRYAIEDTLVLDVVDGFRDRAGTYRIEGGPDGAVCTRVDGTADVRLDVSALGSIALGGVDAAELGAAGRIVELTPGAVGRTDRFFRWRPAPFCSTTF